MDFKTDNIIRAVLFDFGGVFAEEGFRNGIRKIARQCNVDPDATEKTAFTLVYSTGYVLGRCNEDFFWKALKKATGITGDNRELREVILKEFKIRPWFPEVIMQLRAHGLIVCILSDQTDWLDKLDEDNHFYNLFDHIFNSFYMGKSKRDPGLFDDIVDKLGLSPEEILFIDDYHGHIERAQSKGIKTHLFIDKDRLFKELHNCFDWLNSEMT